MEEIKIGVIGDYEFNIFLSNRGYDVNFFEWNTGIENKIDQDDINVILFDDGISDLEANLRRINDLDIPIVLFGEDIEIEGLKRLYRESLIEDHINMGEIDYLRRVLDRIQKRSIPNKILLQGDDGTESIINIDDISLICYDRLNRRSIIKAKGKDYFSKSNLTKIESFLNNKGNFIRADRSSIINLSKVCDMNYDKGTVKMCDGLEESYSNNKLRELKKALSKKMKIESL